MLFHSRRAVDDAASAGRGHSRSTAITSAWRRCRWPSPRLPLSLAFSRPWTLPAADVGASGGEFGRQAYTDGGVFDNLGVRMFRFLEQLLPPDQGGLDGVLVSDVGKRIKVLANRRTGGAIRTAMRASDILMDRVWQLENETFSDTSGFLFARITDIVEPHDDPTALHVEIQRQLVNIRTDFDRFSPLEISSLIQHGYCVGRKTCRAMPELFGAELPVNPPWDPLLARRGADSSAPAVASPTGPGVEPAPVTFKARELQHSAQRRIWSALPDYRDWVTYVYVPILLLIFVLLPYLVVKSYQRSHRISQIVDSLAQGSRDLLEMTKLLEGRVKPWTGESAEEVSHFEKPDLKGFTILQDSRIIDMRGWKPAAAGGDESDSLVYGYRRLKVFKQPENSSNQLFRVGLQAISPKTQVRFPPQQLQPKLLAHNMDVAEHGDKQFRWEAAVDFENVPAGDTVDILYEHLSPGDFLRQGNGSTTLTFDVEAETAELSRWLLLPKGKEYRTFHLIRYETGKPGNPEDVNVVTEYLSEDSTILAFKLLSLKAGYTYEITWYYP